MSADDFYLFWSTAYPKSLPVSYLIRQHYAERWFRIHSLPESKRYAETDADWQILLHRHRTILADLVSDSTDLLLLSRYCYYDNSDDPEYQTGLRQIQQYLREENVFHGLPLIPLTRINLHDSNPEQHEPGMFW